MELHVCIAMDIISISPCSKRISNEAGKELNDCHIPSVSKSEIQNFLAVSQALNFLYLLSCGAFNICSLVYGRCQFFIYSQENLKYSC